MKEVLRDLAGKGLIYGLGASLNAVVAFVLIPFFTRNLQAADYGRYAIAEMVLNLALVALALGMNVAILARYPRIAPEARADFFRSVLGFLLCSTLGLEAVLVAFLHLVSSRVLPVLSARVVFLIVVISALETIWMAFATLYRAEGWAWRFIAASLLQATVGLVATVLLIARWKWRDEGILLGRAIGDLALFTIVLAPQFRHFRPRIDFKPIKDLLTIGLPLIPATFSSMWVLTSPRYFIERYGGIADVGVFAMSARIAGVIQLFFIQPFAMAWMVALFQIFRRSDAPRIYARVLTYYLLVGGALAACVGLVADVVIPFLAGQRFPLSPEIVLVMAMAQVASGLMYPLNIGPYVLEQTSKVMPIFVLSTLLITLLGIGLLRWRGVPGAADALLLVYLIQALLIARTSQRLYPVPFEAGRLLKVLAALSLGLTVALVLRALHPFAATNWLLAPVFLAVVAVVLLSSRFPDIGELAGLRRAALTVKAAWLSAD